MAAKIVTDFLRRDEHQAANLESDSM